MRHLSHVAVGPPPEQDDGEGLRATLSLDAHHTSARERTSRLSSIDLLLQVNHALDAHRGQSDELHDRGPTLVLACEGFVKLLELVDELPADHGFGIEIYPSDSAERREIVDFFGLGRHVASLARVRRYIGLRDPIRP